MVEVWLSMKLETRLATRFGGELYGLHYLIATPRFGDLKVA
jgi:hypothetical protein